jgi:hypothetical protein
MDGTPDPNWGQSKHSVCLTRRHQTQSDTVLARVTQQRPTSPQGAAKEMCPEGQAQERAMLIASN